MRARWDSSKLEHVRAKVQGFKKSVLLMERKLREARAILTVASEAFSRHSQVNSYGFADPILFRPVRNASLGRFWVDPENVEIEDNDDNHFKSLGESLSLFKHTKICSSEEENILALKEMTNESNYNRDYTLLRSSIHLLTLKVRATQEKIAFLQKERQAIHGNFQRLDDKFINIKTRIQFSGEALKTLNERMMSILSRVKIYEENAQRREQSEIKLCNYLENRISFAVKRATLGETRESELETRVLELEDCLEEHDMKIHRAKKVLCRINSLNENDLEGKESCSVTMVLRRVSLTRQSSSANFKGQIPLILDSCGEESDISDEAFEK